MDNFYPHTNIVYMVTWFDEDKKEWASSKHIKYTKAYHTAIKKYKKTKKRVLIEQIITTSQFVFDSYYKARNSEAE